MSATTTDPRPTAAVVIIGDEVLSGSVVEQNIAFFVTRFRELGVRLARVVMVPDDLDEIGATVRACAERFDTVHTTGGVGPTHDDITMDAIGAGFGVAVAEQSELAALIRTLMGDRITDGHLRMARAPVGAHFEYGTERWPGVAFRNVYIYPGIPSLLRQKFRAIESLFSGRMVTRGALIFPGEEAHIYAVLNTIVAAHPAARIGSYPYEKEGRWWVRLTVEADGPDVALAAHAALVAAFHTDEAEVVPVASA